MAEKRFDFSSSVAWNLFLMTLGSFIFALGFNGVVVPRGYFSGGLSGLGLLLYYFLGGLSPGLWYLALNAPIFVLGWLLVSRRFLLYSVFGTAALTLMIELLPWRFAIQEPILAAIAGGALMGAGNGIILRSLGSAGGMDIVAIILNQRYNLRVGQVFFASNVIIFAIALSFLSLDAVLISLFMNFVTTRAVDYFHGLFNERKAVFIISENHQDIVDKVLTSLHRGATLIPARGAYTGRDKQVVLTVVNNFELKRLENAIYAVDPKAFVIVENTFNVLGKGFSSRKTY